jgi:hypothetical protein
MNRLKIPENLDRFFYDYDHSKFLECNSELAQQNYQLSNGNYAQNTFRNERMMPCFVHAIQQLESMYKNYWLSSGSLLGKNYLKFYHRINRN